MPKMPEMRVTGNGWSVEHSTARQCAVRRKEINMPSWLILVLVGVALVVLGVATEIGQFLIWIGVIVLVASLVIGLVNRSRT
jgi:Flp pilus assembly protein TadB